MIGQWQGMGALETAIALVPGLLVAAACVLVFWLGWRFGTTRTPQRDAGIESALRRMASGHYDVDLAVEAGAPDAELKTAANELARALRDRHHRHERRLLRLGEAAESFEGRALVVADANLVITTASESAARLAKLAPGELDGRSLDTLFAGESFRGFVAELALARRTREPVASSLTLRAEGGDVPVRATATWRGDGEGMALLIEDARDGAASIEESLQRYRGIVDGLASGLLVVIDGRVAEANPAARARLGEGVIGVRLKDLVAAEDLLLALDRVARAARGAAVETFRCRFTAVAPAEGEHVFDIDARALRTGGRLAVALGLREIGEDASLTRSVRAQQSRLHVVFDTVADGLALLAPPADARAPWRVGLVNRGLRDLFDLDDASALGASEEELRALIAHCFADPGALLVFLEAAAKEPQREHVQILDLAPADGRTVEVLVRPVVAASGELEGRIFVARDITRHRAAERRLAADATELDRSRDELQRAYEELVVVNRDLSQKSAELDRLNGELSGLDDMRTRLLSEVAHELNSPLTSIRGYTQMILDGRLGRLTEEQRRGLEACLRNVDHMAELVGNVLALSRSEERGASDEPVDVALALRSALERNDGAARARGIALEGRVDSEDPFIAADRGSFMQVLDNLIGNAVKFTPRRGRVSVAVADGPNGYLEIDIEDNGIGIPEDEQPRIWERFYRGRGAVDSPGSGIGLATVKRLVDAHGGRVSCESREGEGTLFRVLWPRAPRSAKPSARASAM